MLGWGDPDPVFSLVTVLGPFQGFPTGAFHRPSAKGIWTFTLYHEFHGDVTLHIFTGIVEISTFAVFAFG